MNKTRHTQVAIIAVILLAIAACSKMDDYKDTFLSSGEIQYTGKADSVKFHSGYKRVQLSWLILSDPKVTRAKVYWNYRKDSAEINIQRTAGVDTIRLMVGNLPEGTYNFEIFTYDKVGHSSIPSVITGKVYGERYEASLLYRGIDMGSSSVINVMPPYHAAILVWRAYNSTDGIIGMELKYKDEDDVQQTVVTPAEEGSTMLMKYVPGSAIEYRTLYKPDSLAIDTFYTRPTSLQLNP
jgi:hypothetical protein